MSNTPRPSNHTPFLFFLIVVASSCAVYRSNQLHSYALSKCLTSLFFFSNPPPPPPPPRPSGERRIVNHCCCVDGGLFALYGCLICPSGCCIFVLFLFGCCYFFLFFILFYFFFWICLCLFVCLLPCFSSGFRFVCTSIRNILTIVLLSFTFTIFSRASSPLPPPPPLLSSPFPLHLSSRPMEV